MNLISKLNKSEFINRLEENTKIGNPELKGSPFLILTIFGKANRKFYGTFDESNFKLTKNSILLPLPYIFEGKIKSKGKSSTEIKIKIKPIWFGYLWIRIFPIIALILVNTLLIVHGNNPGVGVFIGVNIFIGFLFTPIWITIRKKNRLLKDFYKIFEITER
jgi:hypothetical protein